MRALKIVGYSLASIVLIVVLVVGFAFFRFSQLQNEKHPMHPELAEIVNAYSPTPADIELGKRIYEVRVGCIECHGANLAGAKMMDDPAMGVIYGTNITPFGIKDRKDEDIVRAIRYGIHPSGRSLIGMPSFDFEALSKEDTLALVAYVRSVPAVQNELPENTFGPVARVLSAFGKLPVFFPARFIDQSKGFGEKPPEAPTVEFGRYLANACTGCHGVELRGGPIPGGDPKWPEASNARMGVGSGWTKDSYLNLIKTGVSQKTGEKIRPPMPVVALQQMNETEVEALWLYLSSLSM